MMWIAGVSPLSVLPAYVAAVAALITFGIPAAIKQHRYQPIVLRSQSFLPIDWGRAACAAAILVSGVSTNVVSNVFFHGAADTMPILGTALWTTILLCAPYRSPQWSLIRPTLKTGAFLISLVLSASFLPVERLPAPSWQTALSLGVVGSAVDNIPLTSIALRQGGYDWAFLAYCINFGGSLLWFGSSAGVTIANRYFPEAKSTARWIKCGYYVAASYFVGFAVLFAVCGWHPAQQDEAAPTSDEESPEKEEERNESSERAIDNAVGRWANPSAR